jgi:hypothetical protein
LLEVLAGLGVLREKRNAYEVGVDHENLFAVTGVVGFEEDDFVLGVDQGRQAGSQPHSGSVHNCDVVGSEPRVAFAVVLNYCLPQT